MLWLIKYIQVFIPLDHFVIFLGSNHCFFKLSSYQHSLWKSHSAAWGHSTPHPWRVVAAPQIGQGSLTLSFHYELTVGKKEFRLFHPQIYHFSVLITLWWRHLRLSKSGKGSQTSLFVPNSRLTSLPWERCLPWTRRIRTFLPPPEWTCTHSY